MIAVSKPTEAKHPAPLTMNICLRFTSLGDGIHNMLKWRNIRGDTGFLPPPGGAHAALRVTSCGERSRGQG